MEVSNLLLYVCFSMSLQKYSLLRYGICLVVCFFATQVLAEYESKKVGLANVYRFYSGNEIGIEFPLDFDGILFNQNSSLAKLPQKFVLSDGTTKRPFILVDRRAGSVLDAKLSRIEKQIRSQLNLGNSTLNEGQKAKVLRFLTENTSKILPWPTSMNEQLPSIAFNNLGHLIRNLPIGQWYETGLEHRTERFEEIIQRGNGVCIDMALLASLILERFQVSHRLVFGSVQSFGEVGGGHTWIELPDQRILDVAWKTLARPDLVRADGWVYFGNQLGKQFRFAYKFFPIISLVK